MLNVLYAIARPSVRLSHDWLHMLFRCTPKLMTLDDLNLL